MSAAGGMSVKIVSGGSFRMDGGCMFGIIPKLIWEKRKAADESNRIRMQSTCVLIQTDFHTVLVDTGFGNKHGETFRNNHVLEFPAPLIANLRDAGVAPEDVDFVILTHLHFDHAGGCTVRTPDGQLQPQFPNARHLVHRAEWVDATSSRSDLAGAYFSDDFQPLEDAGLVDVVDDGHQVIDGVTLRHTGGHTRGHQTVYVDSTDQRFVFLSDFCATAAHLPPFWTLAYDVDHLHLRRTKPKVLGEIADNDWIAIFGHDADFPAARLARNDRHEFVVREPVDLS